MPVRTIQSSAYIISGLCAAGGGLLLAGFVGSGSLGAGQDVLLQSVAAVVIGGTTFEGGKGGVLGSVAGAFFLVLISAILTGLEGHRQVGEDYADHPGSRARRSGGIVPPSHRNSMTTHGLRTTMGSTPVWRRGATILAATTIAVASLGLGAVAQDESASPTECAVGTGELGIPPGSTDVALFYKRFTASRVPRRSTRRPSPRRGRTPSASPIGVSLTATASRREERWRSSLASWA